MGDSHRVRSVAVDLVIIALVCATAFAPTIRDQPNPHALSVLPVLAFEGLLLLGRRRFPILVLLACAAVTIATAVFTLPSTPALILPVAIAMYSVARHRSRTQTVWLAVGMMIVMSSLALTVAEAGFGARQLIEPATILPAVVIGFAAALGSAIRYYFDALTAARERARRAEESREAEARRRVAEDRLAIARDLHDSVAHRIAVINLQAGVAEQAIRHAPEEAETAVAVIGDAARSVLGELNEMLGFLRESADRDIVEEPDFGRVDGLLRLFAQSGLKVHQQVSGEPVRLSEKSGGIAYRVVQEALTNAFKHGSDRTADLRFDYSPSSLTITVANPAAPASRDSSADGHGLVGMRERLAEIGGELAVHHRDGAFELAATVPIEGTSS
ncbi:sensor histidine kinase [Microbacterium gorillae]|uniref:sensor histidine kinase n=1 Tax=Microbacterium gorillae TaxID=1231063 RepID=UPI000693CD93|nr:histidine kinase [Microbacterium gorillae]